MLERLTNPTISLYEASVLLDVCSATVRRYTNSGVLPHERTEGGQRRFRLRDVLALVREMDSRKKH
jgi:excisionase family DNA binding protein